MAANEALERTSMLIGQDALARLAGMGAAVFGLGGVGGHAAEALARGGIGRLLLVDFDTVDISNINRQIIATRDTLGMKKTEAMRERLLSVMPELRVACADMFLLPENIWQIPLDGHNYMIDALDTVSAKLALALRAREEGIPFISVMGAGNRLDPCAFAVTDISSTHGCPLARVMRRELKKRYGISRMKVVFSSEKACPPSGGRLPGSASFVPGVAGMIAAGEAIKDLINGTGAPPGI